MAEAKQATRDAPPDKRAPLTIRPAERSDAPAMAGLYVQLWESELPMLLVAGKEKSARFLERHLLSEDGLRLRNNFVAEYEGEIVAMYGVSTKDDPRPGFWRPGVVSDLAECLGAGNLPKLLWPIVQNIITQAGEEWPGALYISNLVIKTRYRKYGFGEEVFTHYYNEAQRRGCDRLAGQVMDPQVVAFYKHMSKAVPINAKSDGPRPRGRLARKLAIESQIIWSEIPHG